jgi:geranylgeranyl diphosphate synthase, type I
VSGLVKFRTAAGRPAAEVLAWSRAEVGPGLRGAVAKLPASMRLVAGYHFGWWDSRGEPTHGNDGKAVRPALVLLSAQATGGDAKRAVPSAVAVELAHNALLLHDDVIDGDRVRRHRPATWTVFGVADAILAGDALLALASQCLAEDSRDAGVLTEMGLLSRCVADICHGQSLDTSFEQLDRIEMAECWAMAAAKTAALFGCACSLGALAGGAQARQVQLLGDFGRHVGLAFQLVDDFLGIWGDPRVTGKPVGSDLIRHKKSLTVTAALNSRTAAGRQFAELYRRPEPLRPGEVADAADLIARTGTRAWASRKTADEIAKATESLMAAGCTPEAADDLSEVARMVTLQSLTRT